MENSKRNKTRNKIIEAALEEFSSGGITPTSLEQIAAKADVARRTLYYHFSNKEDLLHAIIDPRLKVGIEKLKSIRGHNADIKTFAGFCLDFWLTDPWFSMLFRRLKEEKISDFSTVHADFLKEFRRLLTDIAEAEDLRFKNIDTNLQIVFFSLFPLLEIVSETDNFEEHFISIFCAVLGNI